MHTHDLSEWSHDHLFDEGNHAAEEGTRLVMWITAAMMVIEIIAGWGFNSMALLADGWYMSSHAVAIGVSSFAYAAARPYARDPRLFPLFRAARGAADNVTPWFSPPCLK